jgi:transcriptional regulator of acetoin/glycerol metabolism
LDKIVIDLSDDVTLGSLRQFATALGRELRISFEAGPARAAAPAPVAAAPAPARASDRLRAALEANNWNIKGTARALGIARKTLYTRMERLGIERPQES